MSLAIWSSHQVFQRVDSAFRALLNPRKNQLAYNRHSHRLAAERPLRVVHIAEDQRPPLHTAGRMVISGRMADVCAELDRLIDLDNQRQMFPH
ncbi:MAG: hypothetical protein RIR92_568 [Pseudomonadota bacterium]|jgi:hypothetical protein